MITLMDAVKALDKIHPFTKKLLSKRNLKIDTTYNSKE